MTEKKMVGEGSAWAYASFIGAHCVVSAVQPSSPVHRSSNVSGRQPGQSTDAASATIRHGLLSGLIPARIHP